MVQYCDANSKENKNKENMCDANNDKIRYFYGIEIRWRRGENCRLL